MAENPAHLRLKLDTEQPVELSDFIGSFTAIGNEVERFARDRFPGTRVDAVTYIREVRSGCIEADFSVIVKGVAGMMMVLPALDSVMLLEDFVRRWGSRLTGLIRGERQAEPTTRAELSDFAHAVTAIAKDPLASHRLEAAIFEDGERKVRAVFQFNNADANAALTTIEDRRKELEKTEGAEHKRVTMMFTRSDIHDAQVDKRTGDRVWIEELSSKDLAIVYSSSIAGERIKHEIREATDNVYKKAFVVDVNVRNNPQGKPVIYAVTDLHEVIDLPEDD